ncbi:MAG TPA: ribose-5-phosphate isomerase RpiA [Thermoanaerobaculia bacterium]|nr:ribose-5-phosphate isomerase RpiA [Thermoanaerobaculia bacterium]
MNAKHLKQVAAREALTEIRSGMSLGLGTGSTAEELVHILGQAFQSGAIGDLRCVGTSRATEALARQYKLPIFDLAVIAPLDLAIDGADEIDDRLRLIKGRGGALLREKIVEQAARRFIVIADESKLVSRLGQGVLPIEVTLFARAILERRFADMNLRPVLRLHDGAPLITDEGHVILDVRIPEDEDIAVVVAKIVEQAGVVETGFFPREATEAIIATEKGIVRRP